MTYNPENEVEYFTKLTKQENMNKLDFLTSVRFWQLFLVGVAVGLNFPFPGNPWVQGLAAMVSVWFGGAVFVGTADKIGQKNVEAAKITSGISPEEAKEI